MPPPGTIIAVCPPGGVPPAITTILNQTIPVNGSAPVGFTASGSVIANALIFLASSSDTTLVPQSALVFGPLLANGSRTLTVTAANGRSGTATISITVTDPTDNCLVVTSFLLTVVPAVPTLSGWAMIVLTALLALAGFVTTRRRAII